MNADETTQKVRVFSADFKILILLIVVVAFVGLPVLDRIGHYQERRQKYQNALQRLQKAGGWQNIQAASLQFFTNIQPKDYLDEEYFSRNGDRQNTNTLPSALAGF
jgi:hypothetical protein